MTQYVVFRGGLEHSGKVEVLGPFDVSSEAVAIQLAAKKRKAGGAYSAFPITASSLAHVKQRTQPTYTVEPVPVDGGREHHEKEE